MSLTDSEILELERLIDEREHEQRINGLLSLTDKNPNYVYLHESYRSELAGVALEGSSRAGKTFGGVDFIFYLGLHAEKSCKINIYRETYASFKDTIYDDFKSRFDYYGIDNPFDNAKEVKTFKIGKSKITFIGCDKISKAHGAGCDYAFFNEVMHIPKALFDQVEMRCRKFWWADYNPSFTDHWFFDSVLNRNDVGFLRTTFKDNEFISKAELRKILSYEPWETGSYEVTENGALLYNNEPITDENQPPTNRINVEQQTADVFMWKVYGLGLRGAMKGVIFPYVTYINQFPDIAYTYGLDFGFSSDPTALVKYARDGKNIYLELLTYKPIDTASELNAVLEALGVSKYVPICADSADRYVSEKKGVTRMVSELFDYGWEIFKVSKNKSIVYWIQNMKQYKIHVVENHLSKEFRKEFENYKWKEVNGIQINQPIDAYNHAIDSSRYGHMSHEINNFSVDYS